MLAVKKTIIPSITSTYTNFLVWILLSISSLTSASQINAIFPKGEGRNQLESYTYQLLNLALEKSGQPYQIGLTEHTMPEARARDLIMRNSKSVTVVFSGTSRKFEQQLMPVRIPAYGGLLGFRLFLINQRLSEEFLNIKTLEDLKRFTPGQGSNWSDVEILRNAGLKVHTTKYQLLFGLLNKGRIDYFPRGASEIFDEYERFKADNAQLAIEQDLVLVYPFASFFFVSKENQSLHDAIYSGLVKAHKDGSFLAFFRTHPTTADVLSKANLEQRHRIDISNPSMTEETLAIPKQYWFSPEWQLEKVD